MRPPLTEAREQRGQSATWQVMLWSKLNNPCSIRSFRRER